MSDWSHSRSAVDRAGDEIRLAARQGRVPDDEQLEIAAAFTSEHLAPTLFLQSSLVAFIHRDAELPETEFPVGSRLKTPRSIIAKLRRSTTRFTQMQDIAGARVVVPTLRLQDAAVRALTTALFPDYVRLMDQREEPDEYGYRAVHLIVRIGDYLGEIQVRTWVQDQWAQLVESLDAALNSDLKHGEGDADWLEWLREMSDQLRRADLGQSYQLPPRPHDMT